ncbi:ABC transporter permease subunit [Beduinella massiliensis]|uniref:ABC transporter permease subunit n=1 Tax=Beduinella massiliensis TaxID=1852363 RepID=UPI000C81A51F
MYQGKRLTRNDRIFNVALGILLTVLCLVVIYPLYYILIASFTDPAVVNSGKFLLYPEKPFLDGYERILEYKPLWRGYTNSFLYMGLTVVCSLVTTIPAAYVLSRRDMVFRDGLMMIFTFTMFFSGGMIPSYLLIKSLHLLNTAWAIVLPSACSAWNLIVARTFFQESIPPELLEAARIDGCDDFTFFFRIVLPLSQTIIAVIGLFFAVSQWNAYFNALMYMTEEKKMPLQVVLRNLILINSTTDMLGDAMGYDSRAKLAEQMKYGVIVIGALPLLLLYPFLQKYFAKGVMIGAIKG